MSLSPNNDSIQEIGQPLEKEVQDHKHLVHMNQTIQEAWPLSSLRKLLHTVQAQERQGTAPVDKIEAQMLAMVCQKVEDDGIYK